MDSDRDLKNLIKEAADMEDAKYEESFSLNLEDQEQSNNYQITNGDQEAQEGPVLSQRRQGKFAKFMIFTYSLFIDIYILIIHWSLFGYLQHDQLLPFVFDQTHSLLCPQRDISSDKMVL